MTRLTLELPEPLLQRLQAEAQKHRCRVEEWVVMQLKEVAMVPEEMTMEERYDRFEKECRLYIEFGEEERQRHCPITLEELDTLGKKFAIGRPLSEIIIEERGKP
ncbi:MAG: hypothetical protein HY673_05230 [Chloroflexi bacterium]|nr:hypothetical protein [Chloroflexota bacterium]